MNYCLAQKNDSAIIATIHKTEINGGFLSSLKPAFLTLCYRALITSPSSFCIVAKENGQVAGFIAGTVDINKFYKYFLAHYFFQSFFILLPKLFSSLKKIIETLLYPAKDQSLPKAELLTIAVDKKYQGRGIAGAMFAGFLIEMKKRNVAEFKVLVGEDLKSAINFYEKNGFIFIKNTSVHGSAFSRIYVFNL